MRRLMKHRVILNRLLKDDRLSPNRRMLGELLSMWLDCDGDERDKVWEIIKAQYGSAEKVRWVSSEDAEQKESQANIEKQAIEGLRSMFEVAEENSEVPDADIYVSGQ